MKPLLLILTLTSFLFSFDAYTYYWKPEICYHDLITNGSFITSTYTEDGVVKTLSVEKVWYENNGDEAYYCDGACSASPCTTDDTSTDSVDDSNVTVSDWDALGLEESEYHFLMGLTANLLGFTLVFLIGFLFILQGRR